MRATQVLQALALLVIAQGAVSFGLGKPLRSGLCRANVRAAAVFGPPPEGFVWADEQDVAPPPAEDGEVTLSPDAGIKPVPPAMVMVEMDADAVAASVCQRVEEAASAAIAERGHFALAIPGGSVLKMLAKMPTPAWASKTTLAYVNHKAVPMDDAELATHAKAGALFLDKWAGVNAIVMGGTGDAAAEAAAYENQLRALPSNVLPVKAGLPTFDMMLIGVGDDGHVGSLYPGRAEVLDASGGWVLPVEMKTPGSITLSLPVMAAAKEVVIAACGVSDKYPKGKSEAMKRAIEGAETPSSFPAVVRACACACFMWNVHVRHRAPSRHWYVHAAVPPPAHTC